MNEYRPTIPATVRDVVYFILLGVTSLAALVVGVAAIWAPDLAMQVAATGGVVTTVIGIIGGGLGVAYRPGAQETPEDVPEDGTEPTD